MVKITFGTILAGLNYYAGNTAERYEETTINIGSAPLKTFLLKDSISISQQGDKAEILFNNVPAGKHRFCIRGPNGILKWRSVICDVSSGNEEFNFTIISIPAADTTFTAEKFEEEIELPRTDDIPDLDEDLNITSMDVAILSSHIDIDGEGNISKGDDWTILQSDLNFDYDFKLKPATSINHKKFIRVSPLQSLNLNMSNPITGIGAFFIQDKINAMIRRTVENIVNKQIRKQLKKRVKDEFGDSDALDNVTATVLSGAIIEDGTQTVNPTGNQPQTIPLHKLQLIIDISVPSELITNSTQGKGCFGILMLLTTGIVFSVLALLLSTI